MPYVYAIWWTSLGEGEEDTDTSSNLNTHQGASWYKAFAAPEAGGVFRKLEFRDRLKHASWLNIAEIEIDVLGRKCTD